MFNRSSQWYYCKYPSLFFDTNFGGGTGFLGDRAIVEKCDVTAELVAAAVAALLPICSTTGPDRILLKMAMASSWLRPCRMDPFTARISSPDRKA